MIQKQTGSDPSAQIEVPSDAVEINDWNDLYDIRNNLSGNYVLNTDLDRDTSGYDSHVDDPEQGWEPIGSRDNRFTGTFHGNGHSITGLNIDAQSTESRGLFGLFATVQGTVTDFSLNEIEVTGNGIIVGGVTGGAFEPSKFTKLSVNGIVESKFRERESLCGGVIGAMTNTTEETSETTRIQQVTSNVDVSGLIAGGICGQLSRSNGIVEQTRATGVISGVIAGGISGSFTGAATESSSGATIQHAIATGIVRGETPVQTENSQVLAWIGGVVGFCDRTKIDRSLSTGTVTSGTTDAEVSRLGGIVGGGAAEVLHSYTTASIRSTTNNTIMGGLAGVLIGKIDQCYAAGPVTGAESAGGLVSDNFNIDSSRDVGVDPSEVSVTNSYWDLEATGQSSSLGSDSEAGLSTDEMTGDNASANLNGFDFSDTWKVTDGYPTLTWVESQTDFGASDPDNEGITEQEVTSDENLQERLQDATVAARIIIEGQEFFVLNEIDGEPADRLAFTDGNRQLLTPNVAVNVAISYLYCDAYIIDNKRRLEYTNHQYNQYADLERMGRGANILSDLSGAIALVKISPYSAASNAASALQTAVEWGAHELSNPYHQQYAKMAATSNTVSWTENHVPDPGGSILNTSSDVLQVTQTMLDVADTVDATAAIPESASTVRAVLRQANSIQTNVSPETVDGVGELRSAAFTAIAGLAIDKAVDSVSSVAETHAKAAAIGKGQAAARRPLLTELINLASRARNYNLGPAGVLRMQALHQTDYQIEAAAWYGQAALFEQFQSSRLGSVITAINGTKNMPKDARVKAESWENLSHIQLASTGQLIQKALNVHNRSMNEDQYGSQEVI